MTATCPHCGGRLVAPGAPCDWVPCPTETTRAYVPDPTEPDFGPQARALEKMR